MSDSTVVFDEKGNYSFVDPVGEMDLVGQDKYPAKKRKASEEEKSKSNGKGANISSVKEKESPKKDTKKGAPRKAFDLASLRSKAGSVPKPSKEEAKVEPPKEEVKAEAPQEPAKVEASVPRPEPIVEEKPPVVEEKPIAQPMMEEISKPQEEKHRVDMDRGFKSMEKPDVHMKAEEGTPVEKEPKPAFDLKQMDLKPGKESKPKEEVEQSKQVAGPTPVKEVEMMGFVHPFEGVKATTQTEPEPISEAPFTVVEAVELLCKPYHLEDLESISEGMSAWLQKVIKEKANHPTSIFESYQFSGVRAYSVTAVDMHGTKMCVAVGVNDRITAVCADNKGGWIDASELINSSDRCAFIGSKPVASVGQRMREAIKL